MGLIYDYLIEYTSHGPNSSDQASPELLTLENAIAYGVASALNDCDEKDAPLYAVTLVARHEIFPDGKPYAFIRCVCF